jgi:hypothetical protein
MGKRQTFYLIAARISLIFTLVLMSGCAGSWSSLPSGGEDVNINHYTTPDDLMVRVNTLQPGWAEQAVFAQLGRAPAELTRLQREDILKSLYGSSQVEFRGGSVGQDSQSQFLQSLYGYSLMYKNVKREFGFTSPFRIRTDESGYDYTVTLIFQGGRLYARPIVTGGLINKSSSKTLFDYISPSMLGGHVL